MDDSSSYNLMNITYTKPRPWFVKVDINIVPSDSITIYRVQQTPSHCAGYDVEVIDID